MMQSGKIQQTDIDILDLNAHFQNLMDEHVEPTEILHQRAQSLIPAVACRLLDSGPGFGLGGKDVRANGQHLLHKRADDAQGFIGLLKGEITGHGKSIPNETGGATAACLPCGQNAYTGIA